MRPGRRRSTSAAVRAADGRPGRRARGGDAVSAVDPSEQFVAANRRRIPSVDVRQASAEQLPFDDARFDAALAQLVVHFMTDPVAGLAEMAPRRRSRRHRGGVRVGPRRRAITGGAVLASGRRRGPGGGDGVRARRDPRGPPRRAVRRCRVRRRRGHGRHGRGQLRALRRVVGAVHPGVGPAGAYLASLPPERRDRAARRAARELLGEPPFTVGGQAWAVAGA